jgi:hypothetical protein
MCPNCGAPTTPDLRFCLECGAALAERCPACGVARVSAFAAGDLAEAMQIGRELMAASGSIGESFIGLAFAMHAALWLGARDEMARMLEHQAKRGDTGGWLSATRRAFKAGLLGLDGDAAGAAAGLRDALEFFRKLRLTLETGIALIDLRTVISPDDPHAASVELEARTLFRGLGAVHLLERLESVTQGPGIAALAAGGTR